MGLGHGGVAGRGGAHGHGVGPPGNLGHGCPLSSAPSAVLYATLGAVVVRRAGNVIGWFLLGIGADLAISTCASAYAVLGITHPGTLPAPELVGLLAEWSFVPLSPRSSSCCCCFRPGRCRRRAGARSPRWPCWPRRWRWPGSWCIPGRCAAGAQRRVAGSCEPARHQVTGTCPIDGLARDPQQPGGSGRRPAGGGLRVPGDPLPIGRQRSAPADQVDHAGGGGVRGSARLQRCWASRPPGPTSNPVTTAAFAATPVIALYGFPALITVAILKHGLYEIDVIINRTIRYGLLSAALTAIYAGIVAGFGTLAGYAGGPLLTAAAAPRDRGAVPATAPPGPAAGEPDRVRATGDALPGARRLRRGHGRATGCRRGTGADVIGPGRCNRRGPGAGLGPGRAAATPAGDLAARIRPARRRRAHRRRPAPGVRRDAGRSPSATSMSCSARSPSGTETSRCRPPRTSC